MTDDPSESSGSEAKPRKATSEKAAEFDDVSTAPTPLPPQFFPLRRRVLEPLDIEELTDDEVRQIRLYLTARRALDAKEPRERPEPYLERHYVWKMIFQLLPIAGVFIGTAALTVALNLMTSISDAVAGWAWLVLVVVALSCAWAGLRVFYDWQHTEIYSTVEQTGIRRPRNRWFLLTEKRMSVDTASLQIKKATRGYFTSFFNIDCWRVTLDSPSDEDKDFNDIRYVRSGDRLKETIQANQAYIS